MIALFCLLSCIGVITLAQTSPADSLAAIIRNLPPDTAKVNRLNDLVSKLQMVDHERAKQTVGESIKLAEQIKYPLGLAIAYRLRGVLYVDRMVLDSGKMYYDRSWNIVKDHAEKLFQRQAGLLKHNYGTIFHKQQKYDSATRLYIEAIRIFTTSGNDEMTLFPYNNLAVIYSYLKDNNKALQYAKGAYAAAVKMNDPVRMIMASNQEMSMRLQLKQYDSVKVQLLKNVQQSLEQHHPNNIGASYNLLAQYYDLGRKMYDSAVYCLKQAVPAMQQANNIYELVNLTQNLGYYYSQAGKPDSSLAWLQKAYAMGRTYQLDQPVKYSLENMVDLEEKRGNTKAAFAYLHELYVFNDSLNTKMNSDAVNELEIKYESEKKESQLKLQDAELKERRSWNYILAGGASAILLILILTYLNYRHRQKLQQQRISELETEKLLTATAAVLKGEEQERTRLAKDLHDGLGGMLSGIKYSLNTMKGNLLMTPENAQAFERSMDMLDSSIREMRRVAHNMMPEALVKFGLDTALKDFCNDINQSGALAIAYQSYGLENTTIDQTTAITIYRIVQELVNNTIKHAAAKSAIVQVSKTDNQLTITVEDDGKGFDTNLLRQAKGIGWSNISNRVEFLKGKLDVNSQPGKGTSVLIEITV